jgi:DNA repair exonuclease SbcCD ATPase subunit
MLRKYPVLYVVVLATVIAAPAVAQGVLSADEKELAEYKLSVPTLKKVMAAMRSMAEEAKQDPRFQQMTKIDGEIEAVEAELDRLQSKEGLTEAEEAQIEQLNEKVEKLGAEKERLEESAEAEDPMSSPKTLTEMERNVRRFPPLARALEREGLSPREYSKFMLAMMQAGMVHGFSQGNVDDAKLPPGVNPENIKFIGEHKAELEAMQKEFETLGDLDQN